MGIKVILEINFLNDIRTDRLTCRYFMRWRASRDQPALLGCSAACLSINISCINNNSEHDDEHGFRLQYV